jgi:hypothetical protein
MNIITEIDTFVSQECLLDVDEAKHNLDLLSQNPSNISYKD